MNPKHESYIIAQYLPSLVTTARVLRRRRNA